MGHCPGPKQSSARLQVGREARRNNRNRLDEWQLKVVEAVKHGSAQKFVEAIEAQDASRVEEALTRRRGRGSADYYHYYYYYDDDYYYYFYYYYY